MKTTTKFLTLAALGLLLLAACKPSPPKAPRGYWELRGASTTGMEAIFRLSVDAGPFIRYLGMAPPPGKPMSKAEYEEMIKKFDGYWLGLSEMLAKFDHNQFIGIGGEVDGKVLFEYDPATQEILSHQPGSEGLRLKRVTFFEPLRFPKFEEKSAKAGKPGWGETPATHVP